MLISLRSIYNPTVTETLISARASFEVKLGRSPTPTKSPGVELKLQVWQPRHRGAVGPRVLVG